jgi:hypothetical protein
MMPISKELPGFIFEWKYPDQFVLNMIVGV